MFRRKRGRAIIINNKYFVRSQEREGCDTDIADLQELFDALHFKVHLHENKNAQVIFVFSLLSSSDMHIVNSTGQRENALLLAAQPRQEYHFPGTILSGFKSYLESNTHDYKFITISCIKTVKLLLSEVLSNV